MAVTEQGQALTAGIVTAGGTVVALAQSTGTPPFAAQVAPIALAISGAIYLIGMGALRVWGEYLKIKLAAEVEREKQLAPSITRKLDLAIKQNTEIIADRASVAKRLSIRDADIETKDAEIHDLLIRLSGDVRGATATASIAARKVEGLAKKIDAGRIVVVEDDEDSALALTRMIRKAGFSVAFAQTLEAGKALLATKPSWVVTDIGLPDGSGWDLLRHIRANHKAVRVAICTGLDAGDPEFVRHSADLRPDLVMPKPLSDLQPLFDAFATPGPAHPTISELDLPTMSGSGITRVVT